MGTESFPGASAVGGQMDRRRCRLVHTALHGKASSCINQCTSQTLHVLACDNLPKTFLFRFRGSHILGGHFTLIKISPFANTSYPDISSCCERELLPQYTISSCVGTHYFRISTVQNPGFYYFEFRAYEQVKIANSRSSARWWIRSCGRH